MVVGLVFVDPRGPDVGAGWLAALPAATDGEAEALTYARIAMTSSWPDPSANREALDLPASETEVRAALATVTPPFGDIPLVVLQAEIPLDFVADLPEPARSAFRDAWVDGQEALASDSTAGRIEFVPDSTHDVPGDAPASVIEAILEVLAAAQ